MWAIIKTAWNNLRIGDLLTDSGAILILLTVFLTAFSVFSGSDQRNFLVIILISIVPMMLLLQFPFFRLQEWPIYLFSISLLFTVYLHREMFSMTSILYSYLFILSFIYLIRLLWENRFKKETYKQFLKYLIYAYAATLVLQQVCVVLNLPVLNQIVAVAAERFKLNALSPEPSYSAVILPLLMFSYMRLKELDLGHKYSIFKDGLEDWPIWLSFLYPMFTMGSGTAFIALILLVVYQVDFKNTRFVLAGVVLSVLSLTLLEFFKVEAYVRAINFLKVVFTFDPYVILITDHSASFRVVPSILYIKMFDVTSINTWLGYGMNYDATYFPSIIPGLEDETGAGGIFPTFVMNFGILSAVALLVVIRKFCLRRWWSFETLFWIVMVSIWGVNNQFAWGALFLLACNKYFFDQTKRERPSTQSDFHSLTQ